MKVEWKGEIIYVGDARQALIQHNIPFEERDEFLGAVYAANPALVNNPNAKSIYKLHIGDFIQYLKALKSRWSDGIPLVDEAEARRRARICADCGERGEAGGCYGCSGISKLLMHIPKDLMAKKDGCRICKCYLNNKVWMSKEAIEVDTRDLEYPPNCWINELSLPQSPSDDT